MLVLTKGFFFIGAVAKWRITEAEIRGECGRRTTKVGESNRDCKGRQQAQADEVSHKNNNNRRGTTIINRSWRRVVAESEESALEVRR